VQPQPRRGEGNLGAAGAVPVLHTLAATLSAGKTREGDVPGQVCWP